ncbi:hypothetical protein CROQUDRAFT_652981 [Cronartium quercuum f. sp. fusiforme G11]|uniref:Uncharacterized protein n=1 Tax=Cronartium quercuum f. sp. fusiforme G11 TaxID=708437 RepID=A0A9P6NQ57_9BASI|nr:hypothetical protein CROQUDRAFT_652981 [Cronartium quercuum f. sp. fusiforme G11]
MTRRETGLAGEQETETKQGTWRNRIGSKTVSKSLSTSEKLNKIRLRTFCVDIIKGVQRHSKQLLRR